MSFYYTTKKKRVVKYETELIAHEYDPMNPPEDFYNYAYKVENHKLIRVPLGTYQDKLKSHSKSKGGKWQTAYMSDRLWGEKGREVDGVVNPANGKRYDSKSKYYKDLKAQGLHISDSSEHNKKREFQGDYNVRKELTEATREVLNKRR